MDSPFICPTTLIQLKLHAMQCQRLVNILRHDLNDPKSPLTLSSNLMSDNVSID